MRKILIPLVILVIIVAGVIVHGRHTSKPAAPKPGSQTTTETTSSDGFDRTKYSTTDPSSLWVVVNKQHPLNPLDYAPTDLMYPNVPLRISGAPEMQMRAAAASALEQMFAAAKQAGDNLVVSTAYRSYEYQTGLYNGYVSSVGQSAADQESARPGYSEHQTGWAVDIRNQADTCSLQACFGSTPEGEWLAANAYKYGFLLRYPADKVAITGYEYEPWHFRYIGTALSNEMHKDNIQTLEEFFHVSGGTTYK